MELVAVVQASRCCPHSKGITRSQMWYLYEVIVAMTNVQAEADDSMSRFLHELIEALSRHQDDGTIEFNTANGVDEMESGPLARVLSFRGDDLLSKEDFRKVAPMFWTIYDWRKTWYSGISDITTVTTKRLVHLESIDYSIPMSNRFDVDMSVEVALACCSKEGGGVTSLVDLPDDLFIKILHMSACWEALRCLRLRPSVPLEGYYISQGLYQKAIFKNAKVSKSVYSKVVESMHSLQVGNTVSVSRHSKKPVECDDDTYIIDRHQVQLDTTIPSVDMAFLFPDYTVDRPIRGGICKHGNVFARCDACDKTTHVSVFDLDSSTCNQMRYKATCVLCTEIESTIEAKAYLNTNPKLAAQWHLRSASVLVPDYLDMSSGRGGRVTECTMHGTSVYTIPLTHIIHIDHVNGERGVRGVQMQFAGGQPKGMPIVRVLDTIVPTARLCVKKTTSFYPNGIQMVAHPLCGQIQSAVIHVKHRPCAHRKKQKRLRTHESSH